MAAKNFIPLIWLANFRRQADKWYYDNASPNERPLKGSANMPSRLGVAYVHSTPGTTGASIPADWSEGWSMAYEWDERKARRAYLIKVVSVVLATIVTAGIPAAIVARALEF